MSVGVGLRAVTGLAMPVAMGVAAYERRRSRRAQAATDLPPVAAAPVLPRLPTRALREHADAGRDLHGFDLRRARLDRLDLAGIDLSNVDLTSASLRKSDLRGADLTGAILDFADLSGADLTGALLANASLIETDLSRATLAGVDLTACRNPAMANVRNAVYDGATRWPSSLDPRRREPARNIDATGMR